MLHSVASPSTPQRLTVIHDQVDRLSHQFNAAAAPFEALDLRDNRWFVRSLQAYRTYDGQRDAIRDLFAISMQDARDIPNEKVRKRAIGTLGTAEIAMNRHHALIGELRALIKPRVTGTLVRSAIDTTVGLLHESGQALRNAADGVLALKDWTAATT